MPIFTLAAGNRKTLLDQALSDIYEGKSSQINGGLFNLYFNNYHKAVDQVFSEIKPGNPLWNKVQQFKLNTAKLAAHKSFKQTAELQNLAASVRDPVAFKKSAQAIVSKYNRYQSAEYNAVVARARSAKQFERFIGESSRFPNIEWIRTRSANPRELHLGYVGIVLPQNHPFWQQNQPGNLWNCKCDWRTSDKPTTDEPAKIVQPAKGLEGNPIETGELITSKHPYFKGAPDWVERNAQLMLPDDLAFVKIETKYGDYLEHRLLKDEPEIVENRKIAMLLLQNEFKNIKLLPVINPLEIELRNRYFGEKYNSIFPNTNPDSLIDGKIIEFKSATIGKLSLRIHDASMQSDIVVIRSKNLLEDYYMKKFIKGQWALKDRENLTTIIIINGGELFRFDRP